MNSTSGVRNTAAGQSSQNGSESRAKVLSHSRLNLDSVMLIRLITAGVLFLGGIVTGNTWPAVSVCLSLAVILIAGYDLTIQFIFDIIQLHMITEFLSVLAAVTFSVGGGAFCAAGAIMLLYRVLWLVKDKISTKAPPSGGPLSSAKIHTAESLAFFISALLIGGITGITVKYSLREFLLCMSVMQLCISPGILSFSEKIADIKARNDLRNKGFSFHSAGILRRCSVVKKVVMEKNGLLDNEELCVIECSSSRLGKNVMLRIAAHACAYSEAPYAKAVMSAYKDTVYIDLIQSFQEDSAGITVTVDGVPIIFGLSSYLKGTGIEVTEEIYDTPAMYLAINGEYAGRILFGNKPIPAAENIAFKLKQIRIEPVLFTNETLTAGAAFSDRLGFDQLFANPISRSALLRDLKAEQKKGLLLYTFAGKNDPACAKICDLTLSFGPDDDAYNINAPLTENSPEQLLTLLYAGRKYRSSLIMHVSVSAIFAIFVILSNVFGAPNIWLAIIGYMLAAILCSAITAIVIRK